MSLRVLFVSKPVVPPFQDGTKCLVRDVALNLQEVDPIVLSSRGAPPLAAPGARAVESVAVYSDAGSHAPAFRENLRAAAWILLRSRADVWHFVFAPNPRTSSVGRWLKRLRQKPVVQTVASPPRSFAAIDELLFGDVIVAQSRWTRERILEGYRERKLEVPDVRVVPPPVPAGLERSADQVALARARLELGPAAPLFLYPGDLEVSSGAEVVAELAPKLARQVPGAVTVLAYRRKTPEAELVAERLRARLPRASTRVAGDVPDMIALLAAATAVVFPVDDLWGKVDLPIVLLEAMALGVPVVALGQGPLADLEGALLLPSLALGEWLPQLARLGREADFRAACAAHQSRGLARHAARAVAGAYEGLYLELAAALSSGPPAGRPPQAM